MRPQKWQRNTIFEAVEAGELDPRDCIFDYGDEGVLITHLPSESSFLLEGDPGHYTATAVVGESPPWPSEAFTWGRVEELVQRWAADVKKDVDTPDLWAELEQQQELLGATDVEAVENTPFSPEEQRLIAEQFAEIKKYLRQTQELSEEQFRRLEAQLDYLVDAASRMRRFDWRNAVVGALLGQVLRSVLPGETVRDVLGMLGRGLGGLFGVDIPELPPG